MKTLSSITAAFIALAISLFSLTSALGDTVEKKAKEIAIPKLEFKDVTVPDAFKMFTTATGIKVFYTPPKNDHVVLTLSLKDVPASEALKYIAALAELKFTYKDDGVYVVPKGE